MVCPICRGRIQVSRDNYAEKAWAWWCANGCRAGHCYTQEEAEEEATSYVPSKTEAEAVQLLREVTSESMLTSNGLINASLRIAKIRLWLMRNKLAAETEYKEKYKINL